MSSQSKISVGSVLNEGWALGLKNAASILGALILWILTIWIPYLNVGTTIAIYTIPLALSRGEVISPLFIFEAKYRNYMGEVFTLIGLMALSLIPAFLFLIVPGIVISIGWSLAIYILLDKGVAPGEALVQSNKATQGYKWTIFGVSFVLGLAYLILLWVFNSIFGADSLLANIFVLVVAFLYQFITLGCTAVIYRNLMMQAPANAQASTYTQAPANAQAPADPQDDADASTDD